MATVDAIVLGAGIAGVSAALHLQRRGRDVLLVDRAEPGEATSFGNAGVIEVDGFEPVTFPSDWRALARYGLNRQPELHFHWASLVRLAPWLNALRRNSGPQGLARYAAIMKPLIVEAAAAHRELAGAAGATGFYRDSGWIKLFRRPGTQDQARAAMGAADASGTRYRVLSRAAMAELEPHVRPDFHTALHFPDSHSVSSPAGVTKAFARHFCETGGRFEHGDAMTLAQAAGGTGWSIRTASGTHTAGTAVIALGPWSGELAERFGYRLPLAVKRGYHRHYRPSGNAGLARPVVDMDNGFVITPMQQGIRLASGIEFAPRDAAPTPVQLDRVLPLARRLFPLEDAVEERPWMGARPCMPDSMPVLGPAPRHEGLWFLFGHGHWGFSLGPVTGGLVADLIVGKTPGVDLGPLSASRFRSA